MMIAVIIVMAMVVPTPVAVTALRRMHVLTATDGVAGLEVLHMTAMRPAVAAKPRRRQIGCGRVSIDTTTPAVEAAPPLDAVATIDLAAVIDWAAPGDPATLLDPATLAPL